MSTLSKHTTALYKCIPLLAIIALTLGSSHSATADDEQTKPSERVSVSTFRAPGASESTVKTMRNKMQGEKAADRQTQEKTQLNQQKLQKHDGHVWVDYATVGVNTDLDGDGYFTRINLDFDVDTDYLVTDVYARLFLSLEQGPWIEYAATDDFAVQSIGGDSYYVDTDLVEGFPPGYYDLRIEIYAAADDYLLATYGPPESGELTFLPLEDEFEDSGFVSEQVLTISDSGGGGSLAGLTLLALLMLTMVRRIRRRPQSRIEQKEA